MANQLMGGARLTESSWASSLQVSRVAVREALMRLAGENLVEFGEKGGCFVKAITPDDIRDIRELREILELGAIQLLFQRVTKENIEELELICADFSSMIDRGYYSGACEADVRFHETIIKSTGNQRLINAYKNSNIPLFHLKLGNSQSHMDDYRLTEEEHRKIVDGLKSKNYELSIETLRLHLERGERMAIEII